MNRSQVECEVKERAHLFVITGPSGVGKSTVMEYLVNIIGAESAPKYTSRPSRGTAEDARAFIFRAPEEFPDEGVLCFESYGHLFGIQLTRIEESLRRGRSHVTIVDNCDTAERLISRFGDRAVCLFIFCDMLVLRARIFSDPSSSRSQRYPIIQREIQEIYSQLGCVDFIIDNSGDQETTYKQIDQLVKWLSRPISTEGAFSSPPSTGASGT